ncbi:hypothetical protein PL960_09320 [Bifidobacterium adolescentis]|uniref:hypothetical protein n=1 Tax=uncultured Bifidobacterium sp. TaxID=165187 RepID=UPI00259A6AE2|nr:hypothetical protein [uncultured Bifidobacterium sp.]MDB1497169.1 hypothetical protein [Bifidobacterium adolescentis]MDB1502425.1 hypothetical protein [Bifidobacterium adolescentis]
MSYRISLGGTARTFRDIAEAAEYARKLSLELDGSTVKAFDEETGLVVFTAKSTRKKN